MEEFKGKRLILYSLFTSGWVILDSLWLTFAIVFLLPPKERVSEGMIPLAISTMLIFFPPLPYTSYMNRFYLALVFSFYFFFLTVYVVPYKKTINHINSYYMIYIKASMNNIQK